MKRLLFSLILAIYPMQASAEIGVANQLRLLASKVPQTSSEPSDFQVSRAGSNLIVLAVEGGGNGGVPGATLTTGSLRSTSLLLGTLTQEGENNLIDLSIAGDRNLFAVAQRGVANTVRASILGTGNAVAFHQTGFGNTISASQAGRGNFIGVTQTGW